MKWNNTPHIYTKIHTQTYIQRSKCEQSVRKETNTERRKRRKQKHHNVTSALVKTKQEVKSVIIKSNRRKIAYVLLKQAVYTHIQLCNIAGCNMLTKHT